VLATIPDAAAEWRRLAPLLRRCRQVTEADPLQAEALRLIKM